MQRLLVVHSSLHQQLPSERLQQRMYAMDMVPGQRYAVLRHRTRNHCSHDACSETQQNNGRPLQLRSHWIHVRHLYGNHRHHNRSEQHPCSHGRLHSPQQSQSSAGFNDNGQDIRETIRAYTSILDRYVLGIPFPQGDQTIKEIRRVRLAGSFRWCHACRLWSVEGVQSQWQFLYRRRECDVRGNAPCRMELCGCLGDIRVSLPVRWFRGYHSLVESFYSIEQIDVQHLSNTPHGNGVLCYQPRCSVALSRQLSRFKLHFDDIYFVLDGLRSFGVGRIPCGQSGEDYLQKVVESNQQ